MKLSVVFFRIIISGLFCLMTSETVIGQDASNSNSSIDPQNIACKTSFTREGRMKMVYEQSPICQGVFTNINQQIHFEETVDSLSGNQPITQTLIFKGNQVDFNLSISTSASGIAAENNSAPQQVFAIVRTTIGNSSVNLRNNAIYDRYNDWMIEVKVSGGNFKIIPQAQTKKGKQFSLKGKGEQVELIFRPLFYQKHKGITYFRPRSYEVWKQPVTGWSSWWAYFRNFNEQNLDDLLSVWKEKQLADFGYKYIQIDDVFQGGNDAGHNAPQKGPNSYYATGPGTWLQWKKDLFPGGLNGYVQKVNRAGFMPGVWMGCFFTATDTVNKHPDWFIQDSTGNASIGNWVTYAINSKNTQAAETLIRPIFRGWKKAGMKYVKIDQLRHYLFDNMNNYLSFFKNKNYTSDDVFRRYLGIAREELGKETFILSCWGVIPQSVGLVDACRIGGDGYGPVTMQQYNSWNGIVWINDPDHCDVYPNYKPAEVGNVKNVATATSTLAETRLRPSLASVAGCMLILSDKPTVYKNDENLEGVKRASPVLYSVPGQLYDYDDVKTKIIPGLDISTINTGAKPTRIDADQFGAVCPWWLNEINRNFESWNVLSRMNWTKQPMNAMEVSFANLGVDSKKEYLVFEFWNKDFLGVYKNSFPVKTLLPNEINTFSIREKTNHPQLISTNRHLTQGGYDLINVSWSQNSLAGKSKVVKNDPYELYIYLPKGYRIQSAVAEGKKMQVVTKPGYAIVRMQPQKTGEVTWKIVFIK